MSLPEYTFHKIPPRGFDSAVRAERRWQTARDRLPFFREWRLICEQHREVGLPEPSLYLIPAGIAIGIVIGAVAAGWMLVL